MRLVGAEQVLQAVERVLDETSRPESALADRHLPQFVTV
jgi:hypothetical protein